MIPWSLVWPIHAEPNAGLPLSSLVLSQLSKPVYGLLDISYKRKKVIVPPIKSPLRPLRTRESVHFALLWQKIKANHPWDQKIKVPRSALLWPKQGRSSPLGQGKCPPLTSGPEKCPPLTFGTRKVSTPNLWDQKSVYPSPLGPEKCLPLTLGTKTGRSSPLGPKKEFVPHPWDQKSDCSSPLGPEKCLPLTLGTKTGRSSPLGP